MCVWCLERPAGDATSPQTGVRDVVSFHVCWNPHLGPMQEQPMLLPSVELHLHLIYCAFHYNLGTNYIPELHLIFMMCETEAEGSLYFWWFCFLTSNLGEKLPYSSIKEKNLRNTLENVDCMVPVPKAYWNLLCECPPGIWELSGVGGLPTSFVK